MRTLAEDREETATDVERRWVSRQRNAHGIRTGEATCWFVDTEQDRIGGRDIYDSDMKWLGSSPGDALAWAAAYADSAGGRAAGTGRWTLEVYGDGENSPLILRVYPRLDEAAAEHR